MTIKTALSVGLRASTVAVFLVLGGCALPGYNSSLGGGDSWYDFGEGSPTSYDQYQAGKEKVDYNPIIIPITPALIRHQTQERKEQGLTTGEKNVVSGGDDASSVFKKTTEYKIGRGDVLKIIVFGHPELGGASDIGSGAGLGSNLSSGGSGTALGIPKSDQGQLVKSDGEIYYPYVGEVQAAGLSTDELRRVLIRKLSNYIRDPQVDVRVAQYRSQEVYISGDIAKPCAVPITDVTLTVLQALDRCDTLQASIRSGNQDGSGVGVQNVTLIRGGKQIKLDLNQVYATGKPIPLKADDRLLVDDSPNRVFVVGEFTKQQALPYSTGGMALGDAIADAGGVNLGTADTSNIYVIRDFISSRSSHQDGLVTTVRPRVFKLNASSAGGLILANRFQLEPRDIVFAAPASLVNFNRALAQLTPSLDVLFKSFLTYDRVRN